MGWNDPDNDKDNDPWSGKRQPPDLDEALKRAQQKVRAFFRGSRTKMRPDQPKDPMGRMFPVMIGLVLTVIWILSGIFIVDPAEQAVILRFGKYIETVGSGPHWIPRFIESKIIVNVDRVSDYSYTAQMLTKDENLVSVAVAVQYRIEDLEDYLFNVADPEASLRQATSSALRQVVGATTLDQLITEGREAWGNGVHDVLAKLLKEYRIGIAVVNVSPQPARAPERVQESFDDAIKAQEDEKRFKEQAWAYEARVVPIATGNSKRIREEAKAYAQKVVLQAKGETSEFLALLPEYTKAPLVTSSRMYFDAMQYVLTHSTKIIVDNKSGNMIYLPLDKLLMNPPELDVAKRDEASLRHFGSSTDATQFDGRSTVRPTESVEGGSR